MDTPDGTLVAEAVAGDRQAFETLIRRHFRVAWAMALGIVRDVADAEDVCQDAFVRSWRRLHQCRQPERFRAWLLTVVRSVALNRVARERLRRGPGLDAVSPPCTPDGWRHDDRAGLRQELLAAMEALTEAQRAVLLLSDLEQMRHREIARSLNISEAMSRRHLSDARRTMRERLRSRGVRQEET